MVPKTEDESWADHKGGPCPIATERKVFVRYRNGIQSPEIVAKERRWEAWPVNFGDSDWDIVAWRLGPG
ncbi:MAG TPA: hypothetical protein VMN38_08540 [Sphingomicrobium sp.]|nr:hypothetical protein [Sphingomicrobium sp.]